jgi:hypothetical protein
MRSVIGWMMSFAVLLVSCKKENTTPPDSPNPVKKILLKDITIPHLPSPYYHFEYRTDSTVAKASFASGLNMYDVVYNGSMISEIRSNTFVNHDTLRYTYDNQGKVALIKFINDADVTYRLVFFTYNGQQLTGIEWDRKEGNVGYIIDRTLTLNYFTDGNVKEIKEHRPAIDGQPEANYVTQFDQYDDKMNVDDFTLWHDGFHDHLFLLPGMQIQKNNPRKEVRTGDGVNYTADYTYTYTNENTPLTKTGDVLFTQGSETGQRFQTNSSYSYY